MAKKRAAAARKTTKKKAKAKKKKVVKKKAVARKKRPAKKNAAKSKAKAPEKGPETPSADGLSDGSGSVVDINRGVELSISQVSLETGFTRETVSKRLTEAAVQPSGKRRGYPVYRLRDILPALYQNLDVTSDPDKLRPFERRAYYQGELDKLKLQVERGELVPALEVQAKMAKLFKILTHRLETLPDLLERDIGLGRAQLGFVEKLTDKCREEMYLDVIADEDDDDADSTAEVRA